MNVWRRAGNGHQSTSADGGKGSAVAATHGAEDADAPLLELRDFSVVFGRGDGATVASDRVSLAIEEQPPRVISIVGESGSGKTTTARSLLGLQPPSSGQALWRGQDIYGLDRNGLRALRREVQAVFQDPYGIFNPFYPIDRVFNMTIRNFQLASSKAEKQGLIEEALQAVNLRPGGVLGRYPHQLSGGERQRVMLARAWLLKPKVIVADEAISMLDVAVRAVIMNILLDFRERLGISTVFITHDLSAAYYLGGDIMVMHRGRVVEAGDSITVMSEPRHPYTRLLVESIPSPDPDVRWRGSAIPVSEDEITGNVHLASRDRCLFTKRCPFVMDQCWSERPSFVPVQQQRVACYLYTGSETATLAGETIAARRPGDRSIAERAPASP
jgi:oligopeptide/dipeptide ABC transporter ATP-binding protein